MPTTWKEVGPEGLLTLRMPETIAESVADGVNFGAGAAYRGVGAEQLPDDLANSDQGWQLLSPYGRLLPEPRPPTRAAL
jgi:hypothetical protein